MNALTLSDVAGIGAPCALIGDPQPADRLWTRNQFIALCRHMMNENPASEFMVIYRDDSGTPRFVKSKKPRVDRQITWAWDTIIRRAKINAGIGFYPSNANGESRWGAIDFDAHDGNGDRARKLAVAALDLLRRQSHLELYFVLCTSGSQGWHLFILTREFHARAGWTLFLKQVVSRIGGRLEPGYCEIFPNETRGKTMPHGIRAPGTWNPKTDALGLIAYETASALVSRVEEEERESPFLYHSNTGAKSSQLNDRAEFYSGGDADWQQQFAILQPSTRHAKLKALVHAIYRQVGYRVARQNANAQFLASSVAMTALLEEHLEDFDKLWIWTAGRWQEELSENEKKQFAIFQTEIERDVFRILLNFSNFAKTQGRVDFPFSIKSVADRVGVSFQYISKLRQRFVDVGVIAFTASAVTNRSAARFRWCLPIDETPKQELDQNVDAEST